MFFVGVSEIHIRAGFTSSLFLDMVSDGFPGSKNKTLILRSKIYPVLSSVLQILNPKKTLNFRPNMIT